MKKKIESKQLALVEKKERHQLEQRLRITRDVKKQFIVVLSLSTAALAVFLVGIDPFGLAIPLPLAGFLLGLSANFIVAVIIFLFLEQGIKSLHPITEISGLPGFEFIENVKKAKKGDRIRILETFSPLINEYHQELATAIQEAIKAGAKVEVLLFHPYSVGARRRAEQLKGQTNVSEGIKKNLAYLYDLQSVTEQIGKQSMQVKLYTALPSIHMYKWRDWAYISLFPIGNRSSRGPNLKVPVDNPFGYYVDETFEELWKGTDEAPTISLDDHMQLRFITSSTGFTVSGYAFAYDERDGQVDTACCYVVVGESSILFSSIYEEAREKQMVIFLLDKKKWQTEPHVLNPQFPDELDEITHACQLIEQRYGWVRGKLGPRPFILRFKNIQEVTNGATLHQE